MAYTYFGDLLGVGNYYRLDPKMAYHKLDEFYRTSFEVLDQLPRDVEILMISDSLVAWGNDPVEMLRRLGVLYERLVAAGLLLRGAIVDGKLEFDPRITRWGFRKMLPRDDTLARAVGLHQSKKGVRLLVENTLAADLLRDRPQWLTLDGYARDGGPSDDSTTDRVLRRVCPAPEHDTYEFLWPWIDSPTNEPGSLEAIEKALASLAPMLVENLGQHYEATLDLLRRSRVRAQMGRS